MSWNNAYERKKFNVRIKREIAEYQAAGMTEEQIAEIVMFDEEQFRNNRRYRMHTQEFCESDFDDDGGDNGKSPLYQKYMGQLTVSIDDEKVSADRYGWIEDIKNTELYTALSNMSEERMDLLTSVVFEGKKVITMMTSREFRRLVVAVSNGYAAADKRVDAGNREEFLRHGKWALGVLKRYFHDTDRNIERWLQGENMTFCYIGICGRIAIQCRPGNLKYIDYKKYVNGNISYSA